MRMVYLVKVGPLARSRGSHALAELDGDRLSLGIGCRDLRLLRVAPLAPPRARVVIAPVAASGQRVQRFRERHRALGAIRRALREALHHEVFERAIDLAPENLARPR